MKVTHVNTLLGLFKVYREIWNRDEKTTLARAQAKSRRQGTLLGQRGRRGGVPTVPPRGRTWSGLSITSHLGPWGYQVWVSKVSRWSELVTKPAFACEE